MQINKQGETVPTFIYLPAKKKSVGAKIVTFIGWCIAIPLVGMVGLTVLAGYYTHTKLTEQRIEQPAPRIEAPVKQASEAEILEAIDHRIASTYEAIRITQAPGGYLGSDPNGREKAIAQMLNIIAMEREFRREVMARP